MDLTLIQGNVVPGFNKDHQTYLLVRFADASRARAWLGAIQWDLASAAEVKRNRDIFRTVAHADARWVNLALSAGGLRLLVAQTEAARFPANFLRNQVPGINAAKSIPGVHALLIVAADQTDDLEQELGRQGERLRQHGVEQVGCFRGDVLPDALRGHEHFGFKDGVSQPRIAGTDWGSGPEVAPGEFVLGYPDQTGEPSGSSLPAWAQNGSFLAFVQLQQHVATFRSAMHQLARQLSTPPCDLAAWVVGRNPDGALLADPPNPASHIGRAYSRRLPANEALRRRILRRGIPYGSPLAPDQPDDGQDRGLLFLAYQSDLERQFEHVWSRWLNSPEFPRPGTGGEALVGQGPEPSLDGRRGIVIGRPGAHGVTLAARLPRFVTPSYGAYFFAPSINALSYLINRGQS